MNEKPRKKTESESEGMKEREKERERERGDIVERLTTPHDLIVLL